MAPARSNEWVPSHEAPSIVPLTPRQLGRIAARGEISVRKIPGSRPHYLRAELEALAANSVRPSRHALAGSSK